MQNTCTVSLYSYLSVNTEIYTLSLHDALPIWRSYPSGAAERQRRRHAAAHVRILPGNPSAQREISAPGAALCRGRSEEHTSELQSQFHLVCRLLLEKKKKQTPRYTQHHIPTVI